VRYPTAWKGGVYPRFPRGTRGADTLTPKEGASRPRRGGHIRVESLFVIVRRLLRVFFGLLYNQMAWTYDLVSWVVSVGQWRSWQRSALPYLTGRPVLEVAHGTGNLLLDLVSLGLEPIGLDQSAAMSRIASRKLKRRLGSAELPVPLVRGQVQALPFATGCLSTLVSTFPTEFIMEAQVLSEFYRVLRPRGAMVCVLGAQITGPAIIDRWAAWLFRVTGQDFPELFKPWLERFSAVGFRARLERVRQPRSWVMVIVAEKPGS
jgi:ubiquinone/menaquinone biosynthesis C-methylase UbiE